MGFVIYIFGILLVVGALAWGASLIGVQTNWIIIGGIVILGIGIMGAVTKTRMKDPPSQV